MAPPSTLTRPSVRQTLDDTGVDPIHREPAAPSRPSDFEMISAVARDAGVSDEAAAAFVDLCRRALIGANNNGLFRLSSNDMRHHGILKTIMPDKTMSTPGSTHALIERGLGATLLHTRTEDNCAIAIGIGGGSEG
jgi:hypothetical protein